jgi:hypothetical protein
MIIGHNMMTDVMQMLRQFFGPLPEVGLRSNLITIQFFIDFYYFFLKNFVDFKAMTNCLFPS